MTIHDWTRVGAGTFHAFHVRWTTYLADALNDGILPTGYYVDPEQHVGRKIADVLALHAKPPKETPRLPEPGEGGTVAVAEAPPVVSRTVVLSPTPVRLRRTLTVRHVHGHRIVALIEILSPGNKANSGAVAEFVDKAEQAIRAGIHLVVLDLLPPGRRDPQGIHAVIESALSGETYKLPKGKPLTFVSYSAGPTPIAYLQHPAVGDEMPDLPLFLTAERYVPLPLGTTYNYTYHKIPAFWREVIEGKREAPDAD